MEYSEVLLALRKWTEINHVDFEQLESFLRDTYVIGYERGRESGYAEGREEGLMTNWPA